MANVGARLRTKATGELSRVTLVAERRRVDVVLPAEEPIGRLLPELLRLLGDRVAGPPAARNLVTTDGTVLSQGDSLAGAAVPDGAILRLVRVDDTPSAPVVHDVTDEVAEALDVQAWRWRPAARQGTAALAALALAVTAGLIARTSVGPAAVAAPEGVAAALAAAVAAIAARAGNRDLGATLVLVAGALGTLAGWAAADAHGWAWTARLAVVAAVVAAMLALLGLLSPLGRGGLIGAGAVVAGTAAWEGVALLQGDLARVGSVLGVGSVVVLGLLPRLALMAAGLTGLDDRRSGGASVSRYEVGTALAAAHRGLALATVVTAGSAAGGALVAVGGRPSPWAVAVAGVLALVLLSRSRAFPLVAEVVVLLGAAVVVLVRLAVLWIDHLDHIDHFKHLHTTPYGPLAALCALAVVPLGVLAIQPPEHLRVRLRRAVDLVETIGVIALFPLVVGQFGVFERLLHQFS